MSSRASKRKWKTTQDNASDGATRREAEQENQRFSQPLASVLIWISLWADVPVDAVCRIKEVDYSRFERLMQEHPELVDELRQVCILGSILNRRQTAELMLARINELAMGARTAREARDLAIALDRLPQWVFVNEPEEITANNKYARETQAHTARAHTRARIEARCDLVDELDSSTVEWPEGGMAIPGRQ